MAYHVHWDLDTVLDMEHDDRLRVVREIAGTLIVNPGSAGDARDAKNGRLLSCAVIETQPLTARIIDFANP